ncbi:MAG: response regulator transcription factor [Bacillota bacterium]
MRWTGDVLVVDDDRDICEMVKIALEAEGFQVDVAYDGQTGLDMSQSREYRVIILDIMLPAIDGWEICRQIRSGPHRATPIIMLTAKSSEADKVLGLQIGADDYVVKPFSPRELAYRAKALIRRTDDYNKAKVISIANLKVDIGGYAVELGDERLDLAPKEFEVLALLIQHPGQTFSREDILQRIWGYDYQGNTRTVDEHIKRLRQKIHSGSYTYIQTVWGVGYKFEVKQK